MQLGELQPVPDEKSYLSPRLFSYHRGDVKNQNLPGFSLVMLKRNKKKKGVIKRWAGDKNQFSNLETVMEKRLVAGDLENGAITVKPGWYQIRFNSVRGNPPSGYYGRSVAVKAKKGELIVVPVMLFPAI